MSGLAAKWMKVGTRFLPFADAASADLPLSRLLRLSLFQVSVGMASVLLNATLNRVMIVELGVSASLVAAMISLPLLFAPARALIGHKSDNHKSLLGWKRVPYIWFGTLLQFGGLAIMPFALLVMTGEGRAPALYGQIGAALAFLMVGAGLHTTQTAGLALATDLAPAESRPRVVALLYVSLIAGMALSSLVIGALLAHFTPTKLIQVIQGAAALTMILNLVALWKQEARRARDAAPEPEAPAFRDSWRGFVADRATRRLLVATGLGAAAFAMQDVLLEPYGGQVLGLGVGQTTALTALWSIGTLIGFAIAAKRLGGDGDPHRLAGLGLVAGVAAFAMVILSDPLGSVGLLAVGVATIGFGGGLFSVGTMTAAMGLATGGAAGLALGAWGAVQASCAGVAILFSGAIRDIVSRLAMDGSLGAALAGPATGYAFVYHIEIVLLFATLVALGPLAGRVARREARFGLTEFPT